MKLTSIYLWNKIFCATLQILPASLLYSQSSLPAPPIYPVFWPDICNWMVVAQCVSFSYLYRTEQSSPPLPKCKTSTASLSRNSLDFHFISLVGSLRVSSSIAKSLSNVVSCPGSLFFSRASHIQRYCWCFFCLWKCNPIIWKQTHRANLRAWLNLESQSPSSSVSQWERMPKRTGRQLLH